MSSIGAHNFALALWDTYQDDDPELQINEFMRRQLRFAASWLQTVRAYGTIAALHGTSPWSVPRPVLDEDDLILTLDDLIDTCPACFAKFKCTAGPHVDDTEERPHPDKPQLIVSLDAQVKAADPMAPKASGGFHDVTGVMGLCCRHDIPLFTLLTVVVTILNRSQENDTTTRWLFFKLYSQQLAQSCDTSE
ncbi:unnamed protein product [Tilletia caries]|nr:unnamed protein product [Tilletia caries]